MTLFKKQLLNLFLLILPFTLLSYEYELAVCTIFKNSKPFLKEWIEFHRLVGVEHFYLYNNISTDDPEEVLSSYVEQGIVTLIDWPNQKEDEWKNDRYAWVKTTQLTAYNDCKNLALGKAKWLAFIDSDEFIVPMKTDTIIPFLREHEDESGIAICWQIYGTSDVYEIPENKLMIEMLTLRSLPEDPLNRIVKQIVRTECLNYFNNSPHWCYYLCKWLSYACPIEEIRLNHYVHRTNKFLLEEKWKQKEKMDNVKHSQDGALALMNRWNNIQDLTMQRFIPQLRIRMGFD